MPIQWCFICGSCVILQSFSVLSSHCVYIWYIAAITFLVLLLRCHWYYQLFRYALLLFFRFFCWWNYGDAQSNSWKKVLKMNRGLSLLKITNVRVTMFRFLYFFYSHSGSFSLISYMFECEQLKKFSFTHSCDSCESIIVCYCAQLCHSFICMCKPFSFFLFCFIFAHHFLWRKIVFFVTFDFNFVFWHFCFVVYSLHV